jgi:hypothetical protein
MLAAQENALLAALRTHRDIQRLVRTVGTLPQVPLTDLVKRYAVDAPALYVVPGRFLVGDDCLTPTFVVAAVARNVAGHAPARKGDGIDLGVDHLMVLATRAIHGRRLGDCSWNLTNGAMVDDELFFQSGLTALEMTFEGSPIELTPDYWLHELDDLLRVHADIDIPPHAGAAEHAKWLQEPPDTTTSAPDAQLDVQLPGASS